MNAFRGSIAKAATTVALWVVASGAALVFGWCAAVHVWSRDEAQALLLSVHSATPADLWAALRYEGSPGLLHSLYWAGARVGVVAPGQAIWLYLPLLAGYILLLVRALPAPFLVRLAILAAPPTLHYSFQTRQYLLGTIAVLAAGCVLWGSRWRRRGDWALVALALGAQASFHYSVVALALGVVVCRAEARDGRPFPALGAVALALSLLAAATLLVPPDDLMPGLKGWEDRGKSLAAGLFSVCWDAAMGEPVVALCLLAGLGTGLWGCRRTRPVDALLCASALGGIAVVFAVVATFKYSEARHHWALTFATLFVIRALFPEDAPRTVWGRRWVHLTGSLCLVLLAWRFVADWNWLHSSPRSGSDRVAELLDAGYPDHRVVGMSEPFLVPVVAYRRGHPPFYSLPRGDWVRHAVWNHPTVDYRADPSVLSVRLAEAAHLLDRLPAEFDTGRWVLLLSGNAVDASGVRSSPQGGFLTERWELRPVRTFRGGAWERYHLYEGRPRAGGVPAAQRAGSGEPPAKRPAVP